MKSSIKAFIAALVLLNTLASAQQINPPPDPCCDCLLLLGPDGNIIGPLSPVDAYQFNETTGTVSVKVRIRHTQSTNCPASIKVTIRARSRDRTFQHATTHVVTVTAAAPGNLSDEKEFIFTKADERLTKDWEIYYVCDDSTNSSVSMGSCNTPYKFTLGGGGCKACACVGDGDTATGGCSVNENGSADISTSAFNGGETGILRYTPDGLDNDEPLSHKGIAGVVPIFSNSDDYTIVRDDENFGRLVSIQTPNTLIEFAEADLPDPKAFVITYSKLSPAPGENPIFRTTTISIITGLDGVRRLRYDSEFAGATIRYEQYKTSDGRTRFLEMGRMVDGQSASLRQITYARTEPTPDNRVYRVTTKERRVMSPDWETGAFTVSDIETTWQKQIFGWVKTKQVIDPDGRALTSTWTYYQPGENTGVTRPPGTEELGLQDGTSGGNFSKRGLGQLKRHVGYDGYEEFYTYTLNSTQFFSSYAGNPSGKAMVTVWDPGTKTATTYTSINGFGVSEDSQIHSSTTLNQPRKVSSSGATSSIFKKYNETGPDVDFGGKLVFVKHEDDTITTTVYVRNSDDGYTAISETGSTNNGTTVTKGIRTSTTVNSRGYTVAETTQAIGYPGFEDLASYSKYLSSMVVTSVDKVGRALTTAYHPETFSINGETILATNPAWVTNTNYTCCGISSQSDQYGVTTFYAYDGLQRQIKSNRLGVTTEIHHNGLTTETYRYAQTVTESLSSELVSSLSSLISRSSRNLSGTEQKSWSPNPTSTENGEVILSSITEISYLNPQGPNLPLSMGSGIGSRSKTTTADGFFQTTESFLDGRTAKTYGDLSPNMEYEYLVNDTGEVTKQSYLNTANSKRETTSTQTDWDGRTIRMDYMDGAFATMEYNTKGQMEKSTDPDGVVTLMRYNMEGEQTITAIDLNRNGNVDYGSDTVQFSETIPALDSNEKPVWKSISNVWQPGQTSPTVVSTSIQVPNGLKSESQSIGVANASKSETVLGGNGSWITTSTSPDGTKSHSTYTGGKMVSMAHLTTDNVVIESQTQEYDALNRPKESIHSRTGKSTTTYLSNTADIVKTVTDPGGLVTEFTYDVRGRQITLDAPNTFADDNDPNSATYYNITNTTYNPDSTVAETNGDQTYRVTNTYDYADRQISMTTYRTATETATTTWLYSETRGFLTEKNYHGENDDGETGADYSYTAAGRLLTRRLERGVSTQYSYDNGGRMIFANYSDSTPDNPLDDTPDVTMSYDALGRQITQSNGIATSLFSYNSGNLQIDTETITYNLPGKPAFTRVIDRSQDNLGRESGWQLKNGTTPENEVAFGYGSIDGRLAAVTRGSDSFSYLYALSSSLVAKVTSPVHEVSNAYEATRNVLASKVNKKIDNTPVSSYIYNVNNYGQRTGVTNGGTAFTGTPSWAWLYNSKGEVVKADHSAVTAFNRAYQYDGIGNRMSGGDLGSPISYTANELNQYEAIGSLNPVHDNDGNMEIGPLPANVSANSTLVWDAENRLIQAQVTSGATVNFVYDSQSRRIAETVGSATTVYIYDGWNPIAEYSTSFALTKTYTWGLDLSGSMQGAGGVGGLLMVTVGSAGPADRYFPTFDGNGNVSEYLDSNGDFVAHYEYDPFGKITVATGSKVNDFAHRFSTKPLDLTTGLYYYGYRFYDPETGRWPSRDMIEERGGVNLYGFVSNNGIRRIDRLGLALYAFDGTANVQATWTHVSILSRSYNGVVEYEEGVGSNWWSMVQGGAFGFGGSAKLNSMYAKLIKNWKNGDHDIDIIGFSRGAALARAFANMINTNGIRESSSSGTAGPRGPKRSTKHTQLECKVDIRFLGVFDTVGSFGVPGNQINIGVNMNIPPNVKSVAHAIAGDEMRREFPVTPITQSHPDQKFSQEVFIGDHSDIGGGHQENQNLLAIKPLMYMHGRGVEAGAPFGAIEFIRTNGSLQLRTNGVTRPWVYQPNSTPNDLTDSPLFTNGGRRNNLPK